MTGGSRRWMEHFGLVDAQEHQNSQSYGTHIPDTPGRAGASDSSSLDRGHDGTNVPSAGRGRRPRPAAAGVTIHRRPVQTLKDVPVHVVRPTEFAVGQEIAERIKRGTPVVVSVVHTDPVIGRRLIDFCSACVYMVGGRMQRVGKNVFLLTPENVAISDKEKQRLKDQGVYTLEI